MVAVYDFETLNVDDGYPVIGGDRDIQIAAIAACAYSVGAETDLDLFHHLQGLSVDHGDRLVGDGACKGQASVGGDVDARMAPAYGDYRFHDAGFDFQYADLVREATNEDEAAICREIEVVRCGNAGCWDDMRHASCAGVDDAQAVSTLQRDIGAAAVAAELHIVWFSPGGNGGHSPAGSHIHHGDGVCAFITDIDLASIRGGFQSLGRLAGEDAGQMPTRGAVEEMNAAFHGAACSQDPAIGRHRGVEHLGTACPDPGAGEAGHLA